VTTALLVDDEPNLLAYLERKLGEVWPELTVVGKAGNGREALALAADLQPDIAFLDIQMPGMSGLKVAEALDPDIRIVFVTAHDEYAVAAFEAAAVDYLLKPVDEQRLRLTRERLEASEIVLDRDALARVISQITSRPGGPGLKWLRSERGGATQLIPVESVVYFKAEGKYTSVLTASEEHLIRTSIRDLEDQLDPDVFWRVHRGLIVRVEEISEARRDLRGRYSLTLKHRPEQLRTSQKYGHLFKGM
jgi:DNA-binding LytR/AlgR family response regulator